MSSKAIFCLIVIFSATLAVRCALYFSSSHHYVSGEEFQTKTTLLSEPKTSSRGQQIYLTVSSGQSILALLPFNPKISYGDVVEIKGRLRESKSGEKSLLTLNYPQVAVKSQAQNPLLAVTGSIRHKISAFYDQNLPEISSSLLLGIVFGIKENMPSSFQDLLRSSGVTHVIAASGMNISMVGGFFSIFFTKLVKRRLALILTIVAIMFYALFSGLEPSILRASIMGCIAISAQILGRQNNSIFALVLTAFVILFISPVLIFDVGFQLSFMSTMGILTLNPLLSKSISKIPLLRALEGDLATTLSAQVFTFPIIFGTFGSYSLISLPVNLLVLWTVPILMVLGALSSLLALIFTPLATLVLYMAYPFLIYFEFVVEHLGSLGLSISIESLPATFVLGYYLIISALLYNLLSKTK